MVRIALVVLMLVGCATPYRNAVKHEDIGSARWFISAEGNHLTDHDMLNEYMRRRAGELCPSGFDVLDAPHTAVVDRLVDHVDPKGTILVVQCRR